MPLYEYKCEQCGELFEVMQKFADTPLTVHEKCSGKVNRLISAPSLHFKGSGWYVTDYAKGSGTKSPSNGSSGDGAESSSSKGSDASKSGESKTNSGDKGASSSSSGGSESKPAAPSSSSDKKS
jgi:putative FmdB family regulatory protein